MSAQHTPGPWYVDDERAPNFDAVFLRVGHEGIPIASPHVKPDGSKLPDRANARLIAAAPCLAQEMHKLLTALDNGDPLDTSSARAALARAGVTL